MLNGQKALIGCAAAVSVDTECVRFRKTGVGGWVHISGFSYSLSLFFVFTFTEVIKAKRVTQSSVENGSLLNTTTGLFTDRTTFSRRGLVQ